MRIAVITNITKDIGLVCAARAAEILHGRADVYMSDDCVLPSDCGVTYVSYEELWHNADIVLVIGGDGTLLRAAALCAKNNIPALGINLGKVGFMTEVEQSDMRRALETLLAGNYTVERRMMLRVSVNDELTSYHALNDAVLSKPEGTRLIDAELFLDGEPVNHYIADGLIIATPTGSTGYSISAGGPVVDPRMNLYIATPICAHMLAVRSAILPAENDITIRIGKDYPENSAILTTDGERQRFVSSRDVVHISKSDYEFQLVRTGTQNFYETLISKLS